MSFMYRSLDHCQANFCVWLKMVVHSLTLVCVCVCVCVCVLSRLSCVQLFVILWTICSLPGFSLHRIFQARILESVVISFSTLTHKDPLFPTTFVEDLPNIFYSVFLLPSQISIKSHFV